MRVRLLKLDRWVVSSHTRHQLLQVGRRLAVSRLGPSHFSYPSSISIYLLRVPCGPVLRGVVGIAMGRDCGFLCIESNGRVVLLITTDLSLLRLLSGDEMRVLSDNSRWIHSSFALSSVERV